MNERVIFIASFGALFPNVSDSMVAKCWHEIRNLPEPQRIELIKTLLSVAGAKVAAQDAAAAAITAAIGVEKGL